jgi:CPA2 family monovalent cation:H+ antiporter-2
VAVACALSSTAISVKLYHDMGLSASSGARFALGVAIFQDIFVILFLVLMPALFVPGGEGNAMAPMLALTLGKGVAFIALAIILARYIIPRLLSAVADTRSRELFTLTVAGLCIGVAFLAALMDLSLILGAFVAGLAVSECIYKHRILSDIAPIKDLFLTIFFVSVGLGIDLREAISSWQLILALAAGIIIGKAILIGLIARIVRLGERQTPSTKNLDGLGQVLVGALARENFVADDHQTEFVVHLHPYDFPARRLKPNHCCAHRPRP